MTNYCLFIMQPREIDTCINSIKNCCCGIDKFWLKGFTQMQVLEQMNILVQTNPQYDGFIITSDDVIINQVAFNTVIGGLDKYPVFTGYCNMYNGSEYVSICRTPLTLINGKTPTYEDYNLIKKEEVDKLFGNEYFNCGFAGFALSGFNRDIWLKYPAAGYGIQTAYSSDHHVSLRLINDGIDIYSHKDAFVYHLKKPMSKTILKRHAGDYVSKAFGRSNKDTMLVGKVKPTIVFEEKIELHEDKK